MESRYLFTSARLGFRAWQESDLTNMTLLNEDVEVMRFFPATQNKEETRAFIERMTLLFRQKGHCYFAVELLTNRAFIGFIGIAEQVFESAFTPCKDIGWRLSKTHWNRGYATEGALRCLTFAKDVLQLPSIAAIAPKNNLASINVMKKIGLLHQADFIHPKLLNFPTLSSCSLYSLNLQ